MNLLKKLCKRNNKMKKSQESWYNNSHEEKTPRWAATPEGAAFSQSGNRIDNAIVIKMIKKGKF